MKNGKGKLEKVDAVIGGIISNWYERVREHYVTEEDSKDLGVEPELKRFQQFSRHRIKFSRTSELDVTYGIGVEEKDGLLILVASVNNKSDGFDYDLFVDRLKSEYWRSRTEKPWTEPRIDHFAYGDLLHFEPRMGKSVSLETREEKADILRLFFEIEPQHEELLLENPELLRDLVENYCLNPLKRIYAESYRQQ